MKKSRNLVVDVYTNYNYWKLDLDLFFPLCLLPTLYDGGCPRLSPSIGC